MKKPATLSSKNQVTIPAEVRKALGLKAGEVVVFDIDTTGPAPAVALHRSPSLEDLAGSVPIPPDVADLPWAEIRERAWTSRRDRPTDTDE